MMTVREVAEVICQWEGAKCGFDPDVMDFRYVGFRSGKDLYYGVWAEEDRGSSFDLYGYKSSDRVLQLTQEDLEAMLEMIGVENTWTALVPDGEMRPVPEDLFGYPPLA